MSSKGVVGGTPVSSKRVVGCTPVCSPVCTATQRSMKFESSTEVLPSEDGRTNENEKK